MKIYSKYDFNEFIICLGYKGYVIKEYFSNYFLHLSDVTIELATGKLKIHNCKSEDLKVTLIDTGINTQTGGRIKRIKDYINNETFMLTYGDGLADINIHNLVNFHKKHGKLATVTAVNPPGRFGTILIDDNSTIVEFNEKPVSGGGWINGGFFVLESDIFNYIKGDETYWEREPLENLAKDGELIAYKHTGFWKPMDTLRDRRELEKIWNSGKALWNL